MSKRVLRDEPVQFYFEAPFIMYTALHLIYTKFTPDTRVYVDASWLGLRPPILYLAAVKNGCCLLREERRGCGGFTPALNLIYSLLGCCEEWLPPSPRGCGGLLCRTLHLLYK